MQYLIVLSPIFLLLFSSNLLKKKGNEIDALISLIEGDSLRSAPLKWELYGLAKRLIELRARFGPRVQSSIVELKREAIEISRKNKKIKSIRVSAYLQQFVMALLVSILIFVSVQLFSFEGIPYLELVLLQVLSVLFLLMIEARLDRHFNRPVSTRLHNLIILKSLSSQSLSVSSILSHIDWQKMSLTNVKFVKSWDNDFYKKVSAWKSSGQGLGEAILELESELKFIGETNFQKYLTYMESAKFMALLISGFLGYFVFLHSLLNSFLA